MSSVGLAFPGVASRPDASSILISRRSLPWSAFSIPTSRSNNSRAKAGINLSELVAEQDVLLSLQADRKRSILGSMAARLGEKVGVHQGTVLAALLRRERLGSTSVGQGTAIPHARLEGISAPAAVVATLQRPIPFDSSDDEPVDLLLALLWPKSDAKGFAPALLHLWRLLRCGGLRGLLKRSSTPAEACAIIASFEEATSRRPGGMSADSGRVRLPAYLREACL